MLITDRNYNPLKKVSKSTEETRKETRKHGWEREERQTVLSKDLENPHKIRRNFKGFFNFI